MSDEESVSVSDHGDSGLSFGPYANEEGKAHHE